ncbi:hypothetical protein CH373_12780 [Leptospira perolatii]|uniref:M23ase beta-sheet core domain-containing protein n=1 Tax=Leptospira perolatii TaxID=2023191 RepID=A0A2M9ZKL6_9LEPT|nr:M23 family metallopeptidase [Leptospira perolatii]PJZ70004.1 hypothetical protein CH360_08905 [Leptospira perolatii]PJZ72588.1 hypothetical protein CH373_12780 [Leptospira perolatii]
MKIKPIAANKTCSAFLILFLIVPCYSRLFSKEKQQKNKEYKTASVLPKILTSSSNKNQTLNSNRKIANSKNATPKTQKSQARTNGEIIEKKEALFSFTLQGRKFSQGEMLILKVKPEERLFSKLDRIKVTWEGKEQPVTKTENGFWAFIPISPEYSKPEGILEITEKNLFRLTESKKYEIPISKRSFAVSKVSHLTMDSKYTSEKLTEEVKEFIRRCSEAKANAFESKTDLQVASDFEYPVPKPKLNSPFYKRRIYNRQKGKPHGGVDFKGKSGDPIFAINDGTVILAMPTYYEGNFTVIDHGMEIYSLYMHQSELLVKTGDRIKKGDLIGKIGSTGMSTGPHLHLGLRVQGIMLDPLSLIQTSLFRKSKL